VGRHLRVQSYHVIRGRGIHVLGAIKAANSSGPGNVELRGWREKGSHQQGGEYARQTPTPTPPCGKTARDRCVLKRGCRSSSTCAAGLQGYSYRVVSCVRTCSTVYVNGLLLLSVTGEEDFSSETSPHDRCRFPTQGSRVGVLTTRHVVQY